MWFIAVKSGSEKQHHHIIRFLLPVKFLEKVDLIQCLKWWRGQTHASEVSEIKHDQWWITFMCAYRNTVCQITEVSVFLFEAQNCLRLRLCRNCLKQCKFVWLRVNVMYKLTVIILSLEWIMVHKRESKPFLPSAHTDPFIHPPSHLPSVNKT